MEIIQAWRRECEDSHATSCATIELDAPVDSHSLLLVDAVNQCLVSKTTSCRYVALSYVWGRTSTFTTTKATLELLCKPGALQQPSTPNFKISRTVSEAILMTKVLGERYLWVDALCIVQDGDDNSIQLNAMAMIYARACLTIVSAHGEDANAGFRGLRRVGLPRQARQRIAQLTPNQSLVKPSSKQVWDDSMLQPWSTRAWTYQEAMFSRRMLIFAHNSVRWRCKTARYSEESDSPDCVHSYATAAQRHYSWSSPQLTPSPVPNLGEFEALVNGFNCRRLTRPEDALPAFAGVSLLLGKKLRGSLISGLPEYFLDICLLWRPLRRLGPAQRRLEMVPSDQHCLPSWSWVGWETEIAFPYTWNYSSKLTGPTPIMLGQTRYWLERHRIYCSNHPETEKDLDHLTNAWWLGDATVALDGEMPPGWLIRKIAPGSSASLAQDYLVLGEVSIYQHESDQSVDFCFPVDLEEEPESIEPRTEKYLHFTTNSANFRLGEVRGIMTRVHTLDGRPAGTLWQHDEADEDFVCATSGPLQYRRSVELVGIMSCLIPKTDSIVWDVDEIAAPESLRDDSPIASFEDIQNVMWIQWIGGIAYRKATGVVKEEIWESIALDKVDVTLG